MDTRNKDAKFQNKNKLWNNSMYVEVYRLAKQGKGRQAIANLIGIPPTTFARFYNQDINLRKAYKLGRGTEARTSQTGAFLNYVYDRLPPNLQPLWEKLQKLEDNETSTTERMELMLEKGGKIGRQHLFLHALVSNAFNASAACRAVNISTRLYRSWLETDPDFLQLINEMDWHKKNFFEECLVNLVARGDSPATIFVNRTYNRDRGYNDKVEVDVRGNVNHNLVDLSVLQLPLEVKKMILDAWRKHKEKAREPQALEYKVVGDKAVPIETNDKDLEEVA